MFFLEYPNENRIKKGLRYSHYVLIQFLWKIKVFLRRVRFNGFDVRFLLFNFIQWLMSLGFSRLFLLMVSLPFGFKFRLIPKSKYCQGAHSQLVSVCRCCLTKEERNSKGFVIEDKLEV
jgi:hypothetical protein